MIRQLIGAAGVAAATIALSPTPVGADKPLQFPDTVVFGEPDPCDPSEEQMTTLALDVKVHQHRNNQVARVDIDATTSTGFAGSGHQIAVAGPKVHNETIQVMLTNPDNAQRYKVNGHLTVRPDGAVVDNFSITCLR